jgi:hypothetical protein
MPVVDADCGADHRDLARSLLHKLDGDDVDAIVQIGTNLSMVRLAAAAEMWLGKPVIAINTATYWHALRANGIEDRADGFGRLLGGILRFPMTYDPALTLGKTTIHRVDRSRSICNSARYHLPWCTLAPLSPATALLADRHVDFAEGKVLLAIQSHLLRFAGKTILIDACVGEHKVAAAAAGVERTRATRYLANLAAAGLRRRISTSSCARICMLITSAGTRRLRIRPLGTDFSRTRATS